MNKNKLCSLPAYTLSEKLQIKEISSVEIINSVYEQIELLEPQINAFNNLTKDIALKKAKNIDEARLNNEALHPFAGIPIAIKDNICTKDVLTTCSSNILYNFIPPFNATVMEKIEKAGLIIIGKTNMDEFAMGSSTENSAFKITRNPKDLTRVPGGSSGGSAAAVSSGMVPLALGSDTGGSIRLPASFCGVVGMKPTYGLISRYGLIAFASSLDQIGPISLNISDNAMLLEIIAGHDNKDSTSLPLEKVPGYSKILNVGNRHACSLLQNIKNLKIGIPKEMLGEGIEEDVKKNIMDTVKKLEKNNVYVEEISLPHTKYALASYYIIANAEASSNLARYDGIKYAYRAKNITELDSVYFLSRSEGFGTEVKRRIMLGTYALSSGYYDAYYKKAQTIRALIINDFETVFKNIDIILAPTSPTTAFPIGEKTENPLSMYLTDIMTIPVNLAGLPAISIPCGVNKNNLPVGLQLIGPSLSEQIIYNMAIFLEELTKKTS